MSDKELVVSFESVSKSYGKVEAVRCISFNVRRGEVVALLGPNGAGKSTLIKMLTASLVPDSGRIAVGGVDVQTDSLAVRRQIGYLPENTPLYPEMYIREYLEYVASMYRMQGDVGGRIDEMIRELGMEKEQGKRIGELSKGYRQRVGIAQAFLPRPQLVILDEPFNGLDPNQLVEVRDFIIRESRACALLFSTHILQEVEVISDKVVILKRGEKVADASIERLRAQYMNNYRYALSLGVVLSVESFQRIDGVVQVDLLEGGYVITASEDVLPMLSKVVVENGSYILSLSSETPSLEEMFGLMTR